MESVKEEIRTMARTRVARIRDREMERMVEEFYAEDAVLLPSRRPAIEGREEIRAFWRATPDEGLVSLSLDTREAGASADLAYEVGSFSRTLRHRHGAPFQDHGKYLVVYRRQKDGGLRAVAEMFNSDGSG